MSDTELPNLRGKTFKDYLRDRRIIYVVLAFIVLGGVTLWMLPEDEGQTEFKPFSPDERVGRWRGPKDTGRPSPDSLVRGFGGEGGQAEGGSPMDAALTHDSPSSPEQTPGAEEAVPDYSQGAGDKAGAGRGGGRGFAAMSSLSGSNQGQGARGGGALQSAAQTSAAAGPNRAAGAGQGVASPSRLRRKFNTAMRLLARRFAGSDPRKRGIGANPTPQRNPAVGGSPTGFTTAGSNTSVTGEPTPRGPIGASGGASSSSGSSGSTSGSSGSTSGSSGSSSGTIPPVGPAKPAGGPQESIIEKCAREQAGGRCAVYKCIYRYLAPANNRFESQNIRLREGMRRVLDKVLAAANQRQPKVALLKTTADQLAAADEQRCPTVRACATAAKSYLDFAADPQATGLPYLIQEIPELKSPKCETLSLPEPSSEQRECGPKSLELAGKHWEIEKKVRQLKENMSSVECIADNDGYQPPEVDGVLPPFQPCPSIQQFNQFKTDFRTEIEASALETDDNSLSRVWCQKYEGPDPWAGTCVCALCRVRTARCLVGKFLEAAAVFPEELQEIVPLLSEAKNRALFGEQRCWQTQPPRGSFDEPLKHYEGIPGSDDAAVKMRQAMDTLEEMINNIGQDAQGNPTCKIEEIPDEPIPGSIEECPC